MCHFLQLETIKNNPIILNCTVSLCLDTYFYTCLHTRIYICINMQVWFCYQPVDTQELFHRTYYVDDGPRIYGHDVSSSGILVVMLGNTYKHKHSTVQYKDFTIGLVYLFLIELMCCFTIPLYCQMFVLGLEFWPEKICAPLLS